MSTTTWVVLSDGKYIKVLYKNNDSDKLLVLKADDHEEYAELCYKVVNNKSRGDTSVAAKSELQDYIQLQVDFLSQQQQAGAYDRLLLVAPENVIQPMRERLPASVADLIVAELNEDLLPESNDDIEVVLGDKLSA